MGSKHDYSPLSTSEKEFSDGHDSRVQRTWVQRTKRHLLYGACLLVVLAVAGAVYGVGVVSIRNSARAQDMRAYWSEDCGTHLLRKEWRTLDAQQRADYVEAVHCTTRLPSRLIDNGTVYDDYPWIHSLMAETKETEHRKPNFLPFHRYLLHTYEQLLRQQCGYTGALPYWDWTLDWTNMTVSPIWDADSGFGGDGKIGGQIIYDHGRCVEDGPFASLQPRFHERKYNPHCLSRGFRKGKKSGKVFPAGELRPERISEILFQSSYDDMCQGIEMGPHNFVPFSIRGDFFSFSSPYDPLWWTWQQRGSDRVFKYGENGSLNDNLNMHGLNTNRQVKEVMSAESEVMCYRYL